MEGVIVRFDMKNYFGGWYLDSCRICNFNVVDMDVVNDNVVGVLDGDLCFYNVYICVMIVNGFVWVYLEFFF